MYTIMNLIFACDTNYGIGVNNRLPPWKLKGDLEKFSKLTIGSGNNVVIMGKNTYLSLPKNFLKNRCNIVISKTLFTENCYDKFKITLSEKEIEYCIFNKTFIFNHLSDAYIYALNYTSFSKDNSFGEIWAIGGSTIYESAIELGLVNKIYLTFVKKNYICDTYLGEKTINFLDETKITNIQYFNHHLNDEHEFRVYEYR
jgi:dihydrofolate reductase